MKRAVGTVSQVWRVHPFEPMEQVTVSLRWSETWASPFSLC